MLADELWYQKLEKDTLISYTPKAAKNCYLEIAAVTSLDKGETAGSK